MQPIAILLANNLLHFRTQAGMTQAELAGHAGVTVETIARLERVRRGRASANGNPSLETMERIATALGIHLTALVMPLKKGAAAKNKDEEKLSLLMKRASPEVQKRVLRVAQTLVSDARV